MTGTGPQTQPTDPLLQRLFGTGNRVPLSFEVFPPSGVRQAEALQSTVERLSPVATKGFSVTMGAGGSSRLGTLETALDIAQRSGRPVMAHLTALGISRDDLFQTAESFWDAGITRILALRGDPLKDPGVQASSGLDHATDLVRALSALHPFEIAVAAYPEKHPEAADPDIDIDHLKEKLDAGATHAYCQFVLDPSAYGRFVDRCAAHGIDVPIIPGVMPLDGWDRLCSFAEKTGTRVPAWLSDLFAWGRETPDLMPSLAAVATVEQVRRLIAYGAPELHVYTMNRWILPLSVARILGH